VDTVEQEDARRDGSLARRIRRDSLGRAACRPDLCDNRGEAVWRPPNGENMVTFAGEPTAKCRTEAGFRSYADHNCSGKWHEILQCQILTMAPSKLLPSAAGIQLGAAAMRPALVRQTHRVCQA
jgi:hypothetical protein